MMPVGVEVGLRGRGVAFDLLRGYVVRGPHHLARSGEGRGVRGSGDAEVHDAEHSALSRP